MVELTDLKKINFMKDLPEEVLEKVASVAQLEHFGEEAILIRQDQEQSLIYMLVSGNIFINSRSGSGEALTLEELTAGQTFGLSSLLENSPSTYSAICAKESAVITLSSAQLLQVFESDYSIGYRFMEKVVEKFKKRMGRHTQLFMDALASHPAIG